MMSLNKKNDAFTLVEIVLVVVLFAIISAVLISIYKSVSKSQHEIGATTALTAQTNDLFEFINHASTKYTIDYEEYWNRSRVGCDATRGDNFARDVDAGTHNGHCDTFTAYGNHNSIYTSNPSSPLLYTCTSDADGAQLDRDSINNYPLVYYTENLRNEKNGCFDNNKSGKQAYGQYKWNFWDMMTGGVNQGNEQFLGKGPLAIEDPKNIKELYLISRDGTQRLFFRRNCKTHAIDPEKQQCSVQILKLRAFDAGIQHRTDRTDSVTNWGRYDGTIDTWACDTAQGFSCKGQGVATLDGVVFNLPQDQDDGWVDLVSDDVHVADWTIAISTLKDPKYSAQDPDYQVVPYAKISLNTTINTEKWGGLASTGRFAISTDTMFGFNTDIYSTEVSTYKGDCGKQLLICPTDVNIAGAGPDGTVYGYKEDIEAKKVSVDISWRDGVYDKISFYQSGTNEDLLQGKNILLDGNKNKIDITTNMIGDYSYYFEISNNKLWDFCPDVPIKRSCGVNGSLDPSDPDSYVKISVKEKKDLDCDSTTVPANATPLNNRVQSYCQKHDLTTSGKPCSNRQPTQDYLSWNQDLSWRWTGKNTSSSTGLSYFWTQEESDPPKVEQGCFFICNPGKYYDDATGKCTDIISCQSGINISHYTRVLGLGSDTSTYVNLRWDEDFPGLYASYQYSGLLNTRVTRLGGEFSREISIDNGESWKKLSDGVESFTGIVNGGDSVQALLKFSLGDKELKTCAMYYDKTCEEVGTPDVDGVCTEGCSFGECSSGTTTGANISAGTWSCEGSGEGTDSDTCRINRNYIFTPSCGSLGGKMNIGSNPFSDGVLDALKHNGSLFCEGTEGEVSGNRNGYDEEHLINYFHIDQEGNMSWRCGNEHKDVFCQAKITASIAGECGAPDPYPYKGHNHNPEYINGDSFTIQGCKNGFATEFVYNNKGFLKLPNKWEWKCQGLHGGTSSQTCTTDAILGNTAFSQGHCGTNGGSSSQRPLKLCKNLIAGVYGNYGGYLVQWIDADASSGSWKWKCLGVKGNLGVSGDSETCSVKKDTKQFSCLDPKRSDISGDDVGRGITYSCSSPIANATLCDGDSTQLTSNTTSTVVSSCTASTKCEYTCNNGYHKDGNSCVANTYSCSSPITNATLCDGDNIQLTSNTTSTVVSSCTASTKCEYTCDDGYHPNSTSNPTSCVGNSKNYQCTKNGDWLEV